ncbi:hypothetical protein V8F06_013384 [Rhypophila decipiens]
MGTSLHHHLRSVGRIARSIEPAVTVFPDRHVCWLRHTRNSGHSRLPHFLTSAGRRPRQQLEARIFRLEPTDPCLSRSRPFSDVIIDRLTALPPAFDWTPSSPPLRVGSPDLRLPRNRSVPSPNPGPLATLLSGKPKTRSRSIIPLSTSTTHLAWLHLASKDTGSPTVHTAHHPGLFQPPPAPPGLRYFSDPHHHRQRPFNTKPAATQAKPAPPQPEVNRPKPDPTTTQVSPTLSQTIPPATQAIPDLTPKPALFKPQL